MVKDYWAEDAGEEVTGAYVASNKADPIPEGTECLSTIEAAGWHNFKGSDHKFINITWRVLGGDYDDRVFFQKIKVKGEDPNSNFYKEDKQDKIMASADKMLRNIDKNAGGRLYAAKREPTTEEMNQALCGASMIVTLGEFNGNQFIRGVAPAPDAPSKPVQKRVETQKPKDNGFDDIDSDLIPF